MIAAGDAIVDKHSGFVFYATHEDVANWETDGGFYKNIYLWMPRQEDWQEIYGEYYGRIGVGFRKLEKFCRENITPFTDNQEWDVLWCLFVSSEVYNIYWDWEKEKWMQK